MRTEIIMPQMGESIAEGTVEKWLKSPGDRVERDEDLFEISTDKVQSVIPSPVAGILAEIVVAEGQKVAVGTVVAFVSDSADDVVQGTGGAAAPAAAAEPAAEAPAAAAKAPASAAPAPEADATVETLRRTRSTPLVRRIAAEHQVDIQSVKGTGLSGRVTKRDILAFIDSGGAAQHRATPAAISASRSASPVAPSVRLQHAAPEVPVGANDRVEAMGTMRANIADHMVMSRQVSAHCQTVHEVDITGVEKLRKRYKAEYAKRGAKLSLTTFLVKAVADALRHYPVMNASVSGRDIIYHGDVNVGVAVAIDGGLIVPVVKRADEYSMIGLSRAIADLSERSRTKRLDPADVQDGTFTLSNSGIFGSLFGVPIINQPQVGILGTGGAKDRVVVVDGNIAIRKMVYFCLTFDHRLIDGATADQFVNHIKGILEGFPEKAML